MERVYTINLRHGFIKAPAWKKTPRAVKQVKLFISKHFRVEQEKVKLSNDLNNFLWQHGMKNPPARVKVLAKKDEEGFVIVELFKLGGEGKQDQKEKQDQAEKQKKTKKEEKKEKQDKQENQTESNKKNSE